MRVPEVYCELPADPSQGPYTIVPCTFAPDVQQTFSLSAFSLEGAQLRDREAQVRASVAARGDR